MVPPLNENFASENMDDYVQRQQDVLEQSFQLACEQLGRSALRRKAASRQANGFGITTPDDI